MRPATIVALGLGLLIGYPLLKKVMGASSLRFRFDSIDTFQFSGASVKLSLSFLVQNPSNAVYNIKAINADLISTTHIGSVSVFTPVVIPAQAEVKIVLPFVLSISGAVTTLLQKLQSTGAGAGTKLTVRGHINVDNNLLPLNETFDL